MGPALYLAYMLADTLLISYNDDRAVHYQQGYEKETPATQAIDRMKEAVVGQYTLREDWLHLNEARLRAEYDKLTAMEDQVRAGQGNAAAGEASPFDMLQSAGVVAGGWRF